jgi:hypothetical protein
MVLVDGAQHERLLVFQLAVSDRLFRAVAAAANKRLLGVTPLDGWATRTVAQPSIRNTHSAERR